MKNLRQSSLFSRLFLRYKKIRAFYLVTHAREPEFSVLSRLAGPGDCVVDIGANMGVFTVFFSRLAQSVYSFEPIPYSFDLLTHTCDASGCSNVHLYKTALSSTSGSACMTVPHMGGRCNYYRAHMDGEASAGEIQISVMTRSLDSFFSDDYSRPTLIKCDVEGAEEACLQGAVSILEAGRAVWMLEINAGLDSPSGKKIRFMMNTYDYIPFIQKHNYLTEPKPAHGGVNYFFVPRRLVDRYRKAQIII
ncbi:MAG: FkbM family methyltransferase [Fibrobacterota bacterium]